MSDAEAVLSYWFDELTPPQWFEKNPEMDAQIFARFGALHAGAMTGELSSWRHLMTSGRPPITASPANVLSEYMFKPLAASRLTLATSPSLIAFINRLAVAIACAGLLQQWT